MKSSRKPRGTTNERLAYFVTSMFENNPNFENELRHLFDGNLSPESLRFAMEGLRPGFSGSRNARIVASLALSWSVPIQSVCSAFKALSGVKQQELNKIVECVLEAFHADGTLDRIAEEMGIIAPLNTSKETISIDSAGEHPTGPESELKAGAEASRDGVFELWTLGYSPGDMATHFSTSQYIIVRLLREAKYLKRYGVLPEKSGKSRLGVLIRHPIDDLNKIGDIVEVLKTIGGSRQNMHSLAKHRGWKISLRSNTSIWLATAIERVDLVSQADP